jgi:hypothetical protein
MNSTIQIISPRPLRNNVFVFHENKSMKTNNSKFLCSGTIGSNPFSMHSKMKESPKFLSNPASLKIELFSANFRKSDGNCSPKAICNLEEDFFEFKNNLTMLIEENEAKSEILSILSSDHNDTNVIRDNIRSSMSPLRPINPLFKTLNMEDSIDNSLSKNFFEFAITKNNKSVHEMNVNMN